MRPLSFACEGEGQGEGGAIGVPRCKFIQSWVLAETTGTDVHAWIETTLTLTLSRKAGEGTKLQLAGHVVGLWTPKCPDEAIFEKMWVRTSLRPWVSRH